MITSPGSNLSPPHCPMEEQTKISLSYGTNDCKTANENWPIYEQMVFNSKVHLKLNNLDTCQAGDIFV